MKVEEWLNGNELSINIWKEKYQHNNENFDEWLTRISGNDIEVAKLIRQKRFLFGGRVLANRGLKNTKVTYSNCYCLPLEDNIEGIFKCSSEIARTYSYGGGCGINLSNLAPRGTIIHNAAKTSSGAVSFANLFDLITGLISQGGRRGALMLAMSSEHPDIMEFVKAKNDITNLTHTNISVMASDKFMNCVIENTKTILSFTRDTGDKVEKIGNAKAIFDQIVKGNYESGEPGIIFWDKMKNWSLISNNQEFKLECVNPCAEMGLPNYGACNLGSFNLFEYLYFDNGWKFNFEMFKFDIDIVVVAMNNVLDEGMQLHPLKEQQDVVKKFRMIGIGVFAFSDVLIKMGIKYGSEESITLADKICSTLLNQAVIASSNLAFFETPYPEYNEKATLESKFFQQVLSIEAQESIIKCGLRNATLLSIAPTGLT